MIFSTDFSRFGDRVTKTNVYRTKQYSIKSKLIFVAISATIITLFFAKSSSVIITQTEAYKIALDTLHNNEDLEAKIGKITYIGTMPKGSVNVTNGFGNAEIILPIGGETFEGDAAVYLRKQPSEKWIVVNIKWGTNPIGQQ